MTHINRPWISSFAFEQALCSSAKMEQVHKLTRNFVASLDLGCRSVKHVNLKKDTTSRDCYLRWVTDWKTIYGCVSRLIRTLKQYRKTTRCPVPTAKQQDLWKFLNRETNQTAQQGLQQMSCAHLERLQETAQVLLNARYNAKLAAAEARRRSHAQMFQPA